MSKKIKRVKWAVHEGLDGYFPNSTELTVTLKEAREHAKGLKQAFLDGEWHNDQYSLTVDGDIAKDYKYEFFVDGWYESSVTIEEVTDEILYNEDTRLYSHDGGTTWGYAY